MQSRALLCQNLRVSFYPPAINERFRSPANGGIAADANAAGTSASFVCGSFVAFSLRICESSGLIEEARFQTNSCGYMIAAADVLSTWLRKLPLADLHGLSEIELTSVITAELGELPPARQHCATVVFEALRIAMSDYRTSRLEEFQGEKALICTCFGVAEETVVKAITENHFTDVDEVSDICRAGSGCGSCRMLIAELIESAEQPPDITLAPRELGT